MCAVACALQRGRSDTGVAAQASRQCQIALPHISSSAFRHKSKNKKNRAVLLSARFFFSMLCRGCSSCPAVS